MKAIKFYEEHTVQNVSYHHTKCPKSRIREGVQASLSWIFIFDWISCFRPLSSFPFFVFCFITDQFTVQSQPDITYKRVQRLKFAWIWRSVSASLKLHPPARRRTPYRAKQKQRYAMDLQRISSERFFVHIQEFIHFAGSRRGALTLFLFISNVFTMEWSRYENVSAVISIRHWIKISYNFSSKMGSC